MLRTTIRFNPFSVRTKRSIALILVVLVAVSPVVGGISISSSNGIMATGADGVVITGGDGIMATGADAVLGFGPNGIMATGADGIMATGADGIMATGADGIMATGADGIMATGADSLSIVTADGIMATGADGIMATGADGTTYQVNSIDIRFPSGIMATGADGIMATGADGIMATGADGIMATGADGIMATGADGVTISSADGIMATGADGGTFSIPPGSLTLVGADLFVAANSRGITISGADSITETGVSALSTHFSLTSSSTGLQSVDPELAVRLNELTDDTGVNAVVVYHHLPGDSDLAQLQAIGITGGTRFRTLPAVIITATKDQLMTISRLPSVRSIYGNRTLNLTSEPEVRGVTGVDRARSDAEIIALNQSLPVTGRNVTVAVLDTGIDATHGDLAGRVARNVKLADSQSGNVGFAYPINSDGLSNTDQLLGHGTFVAGVIAGNGNLSGGRYAGVAPEARLIGLSAGDLTLIYVLNGLDYLLTNSAELGVRVVNCSFSANAVYDKNDPVNIATKMLTDAGVNVVFSAGNTGPGANSLNPYAVAPWVVSVGATDTRARLATFSSRGSFASPVFRPTLVAPGVNLVSTRGSGIANVTGAQGLAGVDSQRLSLDEIPHYTTSSGTSFSAPQVAGAIALMLEANPNLTPAEVRDILQRTATPLPPYYLYEVGAGLLNVHAAVLDAAFPSRRIGAWRGTLDRGQVKLISDPPVQFSGVARPGVMAETTLTIPEGVLQASIQIAWGPLWNTNDLGLYVYDSTGSLRAQSNAINLPGLTGKRERVVLNAPSAGAWRVVVRETTGLNVTQQPFVGVMELGRAEYSVSDLRMMSAPLREDVQKSLRTYTMYPIGSRFRPDFNVSRSELAMSLIIGARVPQYLPGQPTYPDVRDSFTRLFVESVQAAPGGEIFSDVSPGSNFRPHDNVSRLIAAVALVRAAGLRSEAEAKSGTLLAFLDATTIPAQYRGYVSVAVAEGLIQADTLFRPQASFTRGDLAQAMALIEARAIQ